MDSKRLSELDSIRGLAAIAVVLYHYFYRYNELYGHSTIDSSWISYGFYGVHLFFIVSGFVIYWTLERTKKPIQFVISRFSRLFPVYWVSVAITFMAVTIFGLPDREVTLSDALMNLLMFHERLYIPHVDGVYWTLTVELTFYALIFSLYITSNLKHTNYVFLFAIALAVLNSLKLIVISQPYFDIFIFEHIPFFLAGICLFKINNKTLLIENHITLFLAISSTLITHSIEVFSFFTLFVLFFILSIDQKLPFMRSKALVFIGSVSYALYLVHQNIGYIVINLSYEYGLHPIAGILFSATLSLLLAIALTRYIEQPALRAIRKSSHSIATELKPSELRTNKIREKS